MRLPRSIHTFSDETTTTAASAAHEAQNPRQASPHTQCSHVHIFPFRGVLQVALHGVQESTHERFGQTIYIFFIRLASDATSISICSGDPMQKMHGQKTSANRVTLL